MINSFKYQLRQLVDFLEETGVDYALLGGIAVSVYSEPRMTQDIDLNIVLDMNDLKEFLGKSRKYGFVHHTAQNRNILCSQVSPLK